MLVCEQAPISGALIIDVLARARVKLWGLELHESAKSLPAPDPQQTSPQVITNLLAGGETCTLQY